MNSCSPAGIPRISVTLFVCAAGLPMASQCQWPGDVLTYRSSPLTPVAGMCGIARLALISVQRAESVGESVTKRTHIPAESWLRPHTALVTTPSALEGSRSKGAAVVVHQIG